MSAAERRAVIDRVRNGKSILRAMANEAVAAWAPLLHGTVLDLASGDGSYALRRLAPSARWVGVDLDHRPDVRADLGAPLPFADDAVDAAVLMWFLYVAPDPAAVLGEIRRVVRPGGALILATPLVFPVTPEPRDLWRFTDEGLRELLGRSGFDDPVIVPLGGRWASIHYLLDPYLRPRRWVAPATARLAMALDDAADRRWGSRISPNPVGYVARAVA